LFRDSDHLRSAVARDDDLRLSQVTPSAAAA
jgi:hypothetical protein